MQQLIIIVMKHDAFDEESILIVKWSREKKNMPKSTLMLLKQIVKS